MKIKPITVQFAGRRRTIRDDAALWSQSMVARTGYPTINGHPCAQMRVRGPAGDRTGRNYLVVDLDTGRALRFRESMVVREDPYQTR